LNNTLQGVFMKFDFSIGITLAFGQYEPALKLNFRGAFVQFQ